MLLGNIGITVLPDQQAIPQAHQAFDQNGSLKNQQQHQAVSKLGIKLTQSLGTYME